MSVNKIVIAIDGYSSCGKSTFAKAIASKLNYLYLDTGAMYRAVTLYFFRKEMIDIDAKNTLQINELLNEIDISFHENVKTGNKDIYLNGQNVELQIRGIEISNFVSKISALKPVREKMVALQRKVGENKGIVLDGRDIGTVVFPQAELKIFMQAGVDIRAKRRFDELKQKGLDANYDEIKANIAQRDYLDENRNESPLRRASDAILLDNSYMSIQEQMDWVMDIIDKKISIG